MRNVLIVRYRITRVTQDISSIRSLSRNKTLFDDDASAAVLFHLIGPSAGHL